MCRLRAPPCVALGDWSSAARTEAPAQHLVSEECGTLGESFSGAPLNLRKKRECPFGQQGLLFKGDHVRGLQVRNSPQVRGEDKLPTRVY